MSGDFFVDDMFSPPVVEDMTAERMWPRVRWWHRWLRLRCRSITYTLGPPGEEIRLRCEQRAGHKGSHRLGELTWGTATLPNMNASPHFRAWAQTCPLREWVRYEGPNGDGRRISCMVFMTERPAPILDA